MADSKAISESEEKYRKLFESIQQGVFYQGADGLLTDVNPAALRMFGLTKDEFLARNSYHRGWNTINEDGSLLKPEEHPSMVALSSGKPVYDTTVGVYNPQKKQYIWLIINAIPEFRNNERTPYRVMVSLHDITERKKTEKALNTSQNRLNLICSSLDDAILIVSHDRKIIRVNEATEKMFGYTKEELSKKSTNELHVDDEHYLMFEKRIREAFSRCEIIRFEFKAKKKNGDIFPTEHTLIPLRHDEQNEPGILSIVRDITERKNTDEILRLNQEKLNLALRSAEMGVWYYNFNQNESSYNEQAYRILCIDPEIFKGSEEEFFKVVHPEDRGKVRKGLKKTISTHVHYSSSYRVVGKDGKIKHIVSRGKMVNGPDGKPAGIIGMLWDITKRKLVEEKLKKNETKLKRSAREVRALSNHLEGLIEKERSQFASDLHDDLGQKLTALNLNISWIKSRMGVQSQDVKSKIDNIESLINEAVVSINKISHRLRPSILDDIGLRAAIEWLLSDLTKSTGISYNVSFVPENIKIDHKFSLTIFRIIQESLTNVARHSNATKVKVFLSLSATALRLVVRDNGVGIELDKITNINSFGLLGMRERVKSFGGEFIIEGVKGKGTIVKVSIPLGK